MKSRIVGPLWEADVEIVELADPVKNLALRELFVARTSAGAPARTLLLLGYVRRVEIQSLRAGDAAYVWARRASETPPQAPTYAEVERYLHSGELALFLVASAGPQPAEYTCLAGDANLARLQPKTGAVSRLFKALSLERVDPGQRTGTAALPGAVSVHGSGLSIYGQVALPWQEDRLAAPFQVTTRLPGPGARLAVEAERLTTGERARLVDAWRALSRLVNPRHPLHGTPNAAGAAPAWMTLEVANPDDLPRLAWEWDPATGGGPELHILAGQINLLLSDQAPYDQEHPPTSQARIPLDDLTATRDGDELRFRVQAGAEPEARRDALHYVGEAGKKVWTETLSLSGSEVAFDPILTSQFLRDSQDLPTPEWSAEEPLSPPVLWGFMPLDDGWAQLPVPNLTEQIYLDAELERFEGAPAEKPPALLQGAVSFGNDRPETLDAYPAEQPWNLTLTDARQVTGEWTLRRASAQAAYVLARVTVEIAAPDLAVNGLLWLSTGKSTVADALPSLENWMAGLQAIPLKTMDAARDLFPSLIALTLGVADTAGPVAFSQRREQDGALSARLVAWSFAYRLDEAFLRRLQGKVLPPADEVHWPRPWAWRRHPTLPMIQALPLTQSQMPPNYPSPSRQLMPFELVPGLDGIQALFGGDGATSWGQLRSKAEPAPAWKSLADLPLVALSLPGLVLDPSAEDDGLGRDAATHLAMQVRFDLPYTDELNALAQLPPESQEPETAAPLIRETFGAHWARLAERASLAAADAVAAFARANGRVVVRHLVEPFDWPVIPQLDVKRYPGTLTLAGDLALTREAALQGISGRFVPGADDGELARDAGGGDPFLVEAGSLAAHRAADGAFRDQRGLSRRATALVGSQLLRTPLEFQQEGKATAYNLTSALAPLALLLGDADNSQWQIWFRDLPVRTKDGTFDRSGVLSDQAQDINDPEALSREHDYLAGYEWRLGAGAATSPVLPLFGLEFYPLTLDKAVFGNDRLESIEITGRLQLPLAGSSEQADLSNAVRLKFRYQQDTLRLEAIALVSSKGEWPLALSGGESGDAPRLKWSGVELKDGQIQVKEPQVIFFLFGVDWTVPIKVENENALAFPQAKGQPPHKKSFRSEQEEPELQKEGLTLQEVALALDPGKAGYGLTLTLGVGLGARAAGSGQLRLWAEVEHVLLGQGAGTTRLASARLFGDLSLAADAEAQISLGEGALQFSFELRQKAGLQLLPGMGLADLRNAPGFAALTFEAKANPGEMPELALKTAFVEALLACRWGQGLQDGGVEALSSERVLGSSAGELAAGYTISLCGAGWEESLLLNGFLEVKSLISWPLELTRPAPADPTRLDLPLVPTDGALGHTRHTIRILLNQHQVPADHLVLSPSSSLFFTLDSAKPWQFLAIVEHQVVDLDPAPAADTWSAANDRRWTALQEVRLVAPRRFRAFLQEQESRPVPGDGEVPGLWDYGYLGGELRDHLAQALAGLPGTTLVVEASAPHWIHCRPLEKAQMTTLQFLPSGTQQAMLSSPQDFAPSDPADPKWLLLAMPFLGRLQDPAQDGLSDAASSSALQVDPILLLRRKKPAAPKLALTLTHWRKDRSAPAEVHVSSFDTALGRTWPRLDPATLEENWFRLQHPPLEPAARTTQSIMAARPDTPARLSRATALRRALESFRPFYPPALPPDPALPPIPEDGAIVWRRDSLLVLQGVRRSPGADPGRNYIANGTFQPGTTSPHPLHSEPEAHARDALPEHWQIFEFAYKQRKWVTDAQGKLVKGEHLFLGRGDWAFFHLHVPPNRDEVKPPASPGTSLLIYADLPAGRPNPVWVQVGQSVQLSPGRYRFSISVFPAQEISGQPPSDPKASQVVLFAGQQRTDLFDAQDLPFGQWGRKELEFEIKTTARFRVGVELYGPGDYLRNGWYLNDAKLVRLPDPPEGWHVTAVQLRGISAASNGIQRHAAATLLPAPLTSDRRDNPRPVSFAVSPYLGLAFQPAAEMSIPILVSAELLCLDPVTGLLQPAASKLWELLDGQLNQEDVQRWAQETHRRLCPQSPVAVLRFRQINRSAGTDGGPAAMLTTTYSFAIVPNLGLPERLAKRVFRLRTAVGELRFREGQFGGSEVPAEIAPFELAPPQTTGVQPFYLTARPPAETPGHWPWGLSALRLSVQYTDGKQAAIGRFGKPPSSGSQVQNDKALTLWWQAPQHAVQYRSGLTSKLPSWGLPELFRARAIKSLLPVVPRPPLPTVDFSDGGLGAWQAVLPGVLRYWLSGTRAGVMIAIRNQLLRQSGLEGSQIGSGLVSGSVPVQHRTPRPVPLPANRDRDTALQPWASYFEPQRNLLVSPSPADEAFFAATGAEPARRLRMVLVEPARGAVTAGWNGDLVFEIVAQDDGQTDLPIGVEWVMLEAVGQDGMLGYQQPAVPDDPERPDRHRFVLQGDLEKDRLRQLLSGRQPGDVLVVQARVGHDIATDGFYQTLSFPLRLIDEAKHRLPLEPQFIHFEDPEYNRRLASSAATATGTVKLGEDLHTVTLAADRREYNADSRLFLRYDWDDGDKNRAKGKMELYRIDKAGVPIRLAADGLEAIPPGKLVQVALGELRPGLAAEETLQLKLVLPDAEPIFLPLKVVEAPVIPAPEAAYALLRWHQGDDQVECARFAWRPNASLVELVCPDDLRTEMVRRRAVFHWNDTVRPTTLGGYYVQKIAPNGATHIPGRAEG